MNTGKINFNKVCKDYGIRACSYSDNPKLVKKIGLDSMETAGISFRASDGTPVILFDDSRSPIEIRFTAAHELGHILLGHLSQNLKQTISPSPSWSMTSSANTGMKKIDLAGQRFGRLTVVKFVGHDKNRHRCWECLCDCGKIINVDTSRLRSGNTKSCGCLVTDTPITRYPRIYNSWKSMLNRCNYPSHIRYKDYGGRGITICEEWLKFEAFLDWALKSGYKDGLTIDRIDVNGNYCPENCRWVTMKVQSNNRRSNHLLEYKGQTKTIGEWATCLNIRPGTIYQRLKLGWSIEKTLETPVKTKHK